MEYLVITLATILCSMRAFQSNRISMLYCGVMQYALFTAYWYLSGHEAAMYISGIGMVCIAMQRFVPQFAFRFGIAMVAASWVLYLSHGSITDILPVIAFSIGRFSEAFDCPAKIRTGYHMSASAWMIFALMTHDVNAMVSSAVILGAVTFAHLYHRGLLDGILYRTALQRITH